MQGYNFSRLTVGGETHRFRNGFFRFKPDSSRLEFIRSTDNNTWGLGISEEGIIFGSTANRNPSVYMPIPNRYYEAVRGWAPSLMLHTIADTYRFKPITAKVRQVDQHGGYTAGAGHSLYTARNYPQEYWDRTAFVCEPTGHLVGTFVLRRDGGDFHSRNPFNLLASDDEWTAPIMAEVGPDGNVWVIDWYNYIVQHNPTPIGFKTGKGAAYETDLRDKKFGRIYRVIYDGNGRAKQPSPRLSLAAATPERLVATLAHDNLFWRRHAQRLLVERGRRDVLPALYKLVQDPTVDAIGLNVGAIHALWTMHGLGALDGANAEATAVAIAALKHPSAGVRRNAVQVLPPTPASTRAVLDAKLLQDPDAQVRLAALLALADLPPSPAAGEAVVAALSDATNLADRWLPDAATSAAAKNSEHFLTALAARKQPAPKLLAVAQVVADHHARGNPHDTLTDLIVRLTAAEPPIAGAIVQGLARGWPKGQPPRLDERLESALEQLITRLSPERRGLLVRLATSWGSRRFEKYAAEASRALLARVRNDALGVTERLAAARELASQRAGDEETVKALLDLITPRTPPELAAGLLRAVQASETPKAAALVIARLPELTPATRAAGLSVLLSRAEWTRAFLDAADRGAAQLSDLSLDQKQALAEHPNPAIRRRAQALLRRGGALPSADRQKVLEELLSVTKAKGDAAAGKAVFKTHCAKCHVHGGEGERIGPDLTGMAVHTKEHLLTDVLDPSRSVEGNFRVYAVTTTDGLVLTGLLASESKTAIELFDAEAKKQTVLREQIEQLIASPKSLMPEGFEKQLSRKDFTDLLEFLTQRGKYLPLPLEKVATAVSTRGMFYSPDAAAERLDFGDWKPHAFAGVPFQLVDPRGQRVPNVILLYGPQGYLPPKMPKAVRLPCNAPAKAIHLLGGVSGWGYPYGDKGTVSLIVRLHYADGQTEDHPLVNGVHSADYIRRVDVPGSRFAFDLRGRQIRYLAVQPRRAETIATVELIKGEDQTAPVVMAVTVETPQ
jgi:putative heme-binding domain-containing protein